MKPLSSLVPLLLIAGRVVAQTSPTPPIEFPLPDIEASMNSSTGAINASASGRNRFVTNMTLNHYAAERQAYYLAGATNLSLFKNFALANVTDGVLQVGHNFSPEKKDDLISQVITVAAQSNVANNVANLFSKDKAANDLGLVLGYTFFLTRKTKAGLNHSDVNDLNGKRAFQYALLKRKTAIELATINATSISGDIALTSAGRTEAEAALIKKSTKEFYDNELALFKEQEPSFRTSWLRFQGFVPLTSSVYQVAPVGSINFQEQNTWKWSAGLSFGFIKENFWDWGAFFVNTSARAMYTNAVVQKADGISGYTQYKLLNTPGQSNPLYYDGDGAKVYVGELGQDWVYPLQFQVIYLLPTGDTKVGLDLQFEQYVYNYAKTNLLLGIPIFLKGQDDKGVNVEAQFRWRDVDKRVMGSDRFTVGLSVALPFGGSIK